MFNDKIKLLTKVDYKDGNEMKSEQIYIDFSCFDTLNQLINHLCKILKISKSDKTELYAYYESSKIILNDIKNFLMIVSNCVILKSQLQLELDLQTGNVIFIEIQESLNLTLKEKNVV